MKKILAIDYGDVRVGLAISDALNITAQGMDTLVINKSDKKFINSIVNIVNENNIGTIVMGYPKNMDGTLSLKAIHIDELIGQLSTKIDSSVEIKKWDERLTTVSAYKMMRELNISQKSKNQYADKFAAIYILEGYLNMISNSKCQN